jgi:hypothetical protein
MKQYHALLNYILNNGKVKDDRSKITALSELPIERCQQRCRRPKNDGQVTMSDLLDYACTHHGIISLWRFNEVLRPSSVTGA